VGIGACLRTRELLFGVSGDRRRTLETAAAGLRDIDGAAAMVQVHRLWLDDLIERPETTFRRLRPGSRRPPRVPFIGGTMARTWGCLRAI
jgi:hypothetical protein